MPIDPIALRNRILFRLQEAHHATDPTVSDTWGAVAKALLDFGIGPGVTSHPLLTDRNLPHQHSATSIDTDTSGFNHNLSVLDDTVQKALDTLDDLNLSSVIIASWDVSKVRYFFIDGTNGNDANVGYIDDAPGTDFTSRTAEVASVAIKTTSRLEAITPFVGAGRMLVRLFKPRTGDVRYDHVAPGDGLGREDRSLLSGYSVFHSRGSDLTNSAIDKKTLGFSNNAFPGPNTDHSWDVGTVTVATEGTCIQLVGATLPLSANLPGYRIRWVHSGVTYYAPVRWGNTIGAATDTLTAWYLTNTMTTGDHIWLERPGVWLKSFTESASGTGNGASNTLFAGFGVQTSMAIGHSDDPTQVNYTHVVTSPTLTITNTNATGRADGTATVNLEPTYKDEIGALISPVGFGIWAKAIQFTGLSFNGAYSAFVSGVSTVSASTISFGASSLRAIYLYQGEGGLQLSNLNHGAIVLQHSGAAILTGMRGVSIWSPSIQVNPVGQKSSVSFQDMHNLLLAVPQAEPASPGITLKSGQYTATLDFGNESIPGTISCGNGVRVEYDSGSQFTLVNYDSLQATGFEVIGGQKVVCKVTGGGTGYTGGVLPCPRGVPMQIVNYPGCTDYPQPMPSGLVVAGTTDTGGEQAVFLNNSIFAPQNIIGVTLTNYTNNADLGGGITGGWVVVGNDTIMVLRKDSVSAAPAVGVPVFASFHNEFTPGLTGGFSVTEFQLGDDFPSYCLGHVLPIGDPSTSFNVPVFWKPSHQVVQIRTLGDYFIKTSDTSLADVPGLFCLVQPGVTYVLDARLRMGTSAGGAKISLAGTASASGFCFLSVMATQISPPLLSSIQEMVGTGDGGMVTFSGVNNSDVAIRGVFTVDTGGYLYLRFAQLVSDLVGSQLVTGSFLSVRRSG